MITRIKINGFKSLVDTELYFGPFTCIVGANAIGKSNFFDALSFLSNLADKTIIEAAKSVRSENQKHSNIGDMFFRTGDVSVKKMSFEIDMLISAIGIDDLGQLAKATITSLRYNLELGLNGDVGDGDPIQILREELHPITLRETKRSLYFDTKPEWVESVLDGRRSTNRPFISADSGKIKLHQDGKKGRTTDFVASIMPRTLLSTVTAESPTAFLVRQEMRSWMMLQFEPSALRHPNFIYEVKNAEIKSNGLNLPATLYRLHNAETDRDVYQELTNKLSSLISDVSEIRIDKDEKRDLLTLQIVFADGLVLPAQSLSDGTLRFLGLSILDADNLRSRVVCLEEPENGINPTKICDMVELLQDMATDTRFASDAANPLRQVIVNTHSPIVASGIPDHSLYLAERKEAYSEEFGKKIIFTSFSAIKDTWRTKTENLLADTTTLGDMICYLEEPMYSRRSAVGESDIGESAQAKATGSKDKKTVAQNVRGQLLIPFEEFEGK